MSYQQYMPASSNMPSLNSSLLPSQSDMIRQPLKPSQTPNYHDQVVESNPYLINNNRISDQADFENGHHHTVSNKERAYNPNAYSGYQEK